MSEFVQKSENGEYVLTPKGNKHIYRLSAQKLFHYYLVKSLNKSNEEAVSTLKSAAGYLKENFNSLEDYLGKIADVANYCGIPDAELFEKFMSRHFISTIEKEKSAFLEKERPKTTLSYENQTWVPSQKLIELYAGLFTGAPALDFTRQKPNLEGGGPPQEVTQLEKNIKAPQPETSKENVQKPAPKEEAQRTPQTSALPGTSILQSLKAPFEEVAPLDFTQMRHTPGPKAREPQEAAKKSPEPPKSPGAPNEPKPLPGKICLEQFGSSFDQSPPLSRQVKPRAQNGDLPPQELIGLKNVATLLSKIKLFTKNRDNEGYKNWYLDLTPQTKAALKINTLVSKEMKREAVNWEQNLQELSRALHIHLNTLEQLTNEIKKHRNALHLIQSSIAEAKKKFDLPFSEANALYSQLISAQGKQTDAEQFKTTLQFMLKGISSEQGRHYLFEKLTQTAL